LKSRQFVDSKRHGVETSGPAASSSEGNNNESSQQQPQYIKGYEETVMRMKRAKEMADIKRAQIEK